MFYIEAPSTLHFPMCDPNTEIYANENWFIKIFFGLSSSAGFEHKITVQASPSVDKRKNQRSESTTPPASPGVIPRLRAIRCERKPPERSESVRDGKRETVGCLAVPQ